MTDSDLVASVLMRPPKLHAPPLSAAELGFEEGSSPSEPPSSSLSPPCSWDGFVGDLGSDLWVVSGSGGSRSSDNIDLKKFMN